MSDTTSTDAPSLVLIRYANLTGAEVIVTANQYGTHTEMGWFCTGCMTSIRGHHHMPSIREAANEHATTCRALPPTAAATA